MSDQPVLFWFRRDLRLTDNTALHAALASGAPVIPVFIFDPGILASPYTGEPRMAFLNRALAALDQTLRERGSRLLIRRGRPIEVLRQLAAETGAQALYFNRDYTTFARHRDKQVEESLDLAVYSFDDAVLLPPGAVMKTNGAPYTVYSPFMRQWRELPKPPVLSDVPGRLAATSSEDSEQLQVVWDGALPQASEQAAQQRLAAFTAEPIYNYETRRNNLTPNPFEDEDQDTSCLSPYLRFGLISPRQAYWAAQQAFERAENKEDRRSVDVWINELIWREFYVHIMAHFPHVERGNFRAQYDRLEWREAPDELRAWQDGLTGYPVVDAAMRQLKAVGWLPNRARMIVASFLTKDLLIDWRQGEKHFMRWLIDGDPAANNGGWQWTAGTGTDAQPYFRIFNPVMQSQKFDPNGVYIRRWVPELRNIPDRFIHAPWNMPQPPQDYPPPLVDHHIARERTIAAFRQIEPEKEAY
jgi:deoxyribodipyrimidine photo-lyase